MSDDEIYAAPAAGLSLPLPDGKPWPANGKWVPHDEYVRRRIADGDLVVSAARTEAPAEAEPETSAEPEASSTTKRRRS